jgi:four helix bundle protein
MTDFLEWDRKNDARRWEDPVWRLRTYRLASYAVEQAWLDARQLQTHGLTRGIADQLYRSVGSIGATTTEGYSRSGVRDRIRYLEYALGSARESRHWYRSGVHVLGEERVDMAVNPINQIVHLLLRTISNERNKLPAKYRPIL